MSIIRHSWYGDQVLRDSVNYNEKQLRRIAVTMQRDIKQSFKGYGVNPETGERNPSPPGEVPAVQTGHLRRSIAQEVERRLWNVAARIGTNVRYGRYLEFGTPKMAPRPWLRPAIDRFRAAALRKFVRTV